MGAGGGGGGVGGLIFGPGMLFDFIGIIGVLIFTPFKSFLSL